MDMSWSVRTGSPIRRIRRGGFIPQLKALTGLAVLFAVQEELLSLDTRIAELFPEQVPEVDSEVQKHRIEMLTIRHLMTMTTGMTGILSGRS